MQTNLTTNESFYVVELQRTTLKSVMVAVYMSILFLFSVPGNILIIFVQFKTRGKSSTDYYIITMAVFDLLIGSVVSPMYILRNFNNTWTAVRGMLFCRLQVFMTIMATIASTLLLGAVSVDRYMLTCRCEASMGFKLRTRAKLSGIGISVISVVFSVFNMMIVGYDNYSDDCEYLVQYKVASYAVSALMMLMFICVFSTIVVCYTRVSVMLRHRHNKRMELRLNITDMDCSEKSHNRFSDFRQSSKARQNGIKRSTYDKKLDDQKTLEGAIDIFTIQNHNPNKVHNNHDCSKENETSVKYEAIKTTNSRYACNKVAPELNLRKKHDITLKEERTLNRITLMLFLISVVYILSYIVTWSASFVRIPAHTLNDQTTEGLLHIAQLLFLVNCAVNPTFYFIMSTKFKKMVLQIIKCW